MKKHWMKYKSYPILKMYGLKKKMVNGITMKITKSYTPNGSKAKEDIII